RRVYRRRLGLLGELLAVLVNGDRQMDVEGYWQGRQSQHLYLPCTRFEQIRAAHDVGDPVLSVVHCRSEVKSIDPVGAIHDEISHFALQIAALRPEEPIVEI